MFKFDKFPIKLRYQKLNNNNDVILERDVLVYGYICNNHLIAVEELDTVADVYLLPINVFNDRFKDYEMVGE